MPEVSIITALHNCVDLTRAYIESLEKHTTDIDWELILVDDVSTDATGAFLDELASDKRIRIIRNKENLGFSGSNNKGASIAQAPVLAFLNNDLLLTEGWLKPMLTALKDCENPGIVGNVQINPRTGLIDHAGVFFGLDGMPRQARKNRKHPPKNEFTEWFAVTAACMVIEKEKFIKTGGFDEAFRNGFEDIDLCVKLRQSGFRHYVCNRSRIFHCVSSSPGRHHHNDRNSELFESRWTSITREWGKFDWAPEYLQRYARHWWKFNLSKWWLAIRMVFADFKNRHMIYRS